MTQLPLFPSRQIARWFRAREDYHAAQKSHRGQSKAWSRLNSETTKLLMLENEEAGMKKRGRAV